MIDLSYFIQISGNKPSFLLKVMDIFIHETPKDLENLEIYFHDSNYQKVRETCHKLKGLFKSYNLKTLTENTTLLESESKEGHFSEKSSSLLNDIKEEYKIAREEMIQLTNHYKN